MTLNLSSAPQPDPDGATERYTVGVDLGQSHDPTAIAAVRRVDYAGARPIFQVGHLERLPLGTPYPGVVNHVNRLMGKPPLRGRAELVIDFTGVGRPVFDMFLSTGASPIGVTITAGDATTRDGRIYRVPKLVLISRVQALLHDGRLKIHKALPDAAALVSELQDFKAEVSDSGYWKFGARAGKHDDLILAVAIALWRAHGDMISGFGVLEYYRIESEKVRFGIADDARAKEPPSSTNGGVTMRAPAGGASNISAADGYAYIVGGDGTVLVRAGDVGALTLAGFTRVEPETENV